MPRSWVSFTSAARACIALAFLTGCTKSEAKHDSSSQTTSPVAAASGVDVLYGNRCAHCHGTTGKGDGPAGSALRPRPADFTLSAWQDAVTDDALRKVITKGGSSVGKSALMPPNPDLERDAQTLDALVKRIRGFGGR